VLDLVPWIDQQRADPVAQHSIGGAIEQPVEIVIIVVAPGRVSAYKDEQAYPPIAGGKVVREFGSSRVAHESHARGSFRIHVGTK
jgi:hypothetical protein